MMRIVTIANCLAVGSLITLVSTQAGANILGIFPAGSGCKSAAMETAGDCGEAQTLLYNPAVMSSIPEGFSGELGIARLQHSYEHPNFDPVHVNLLSPMFSEGWMGHFADGRGSWGFAVMPSSLADLNIHGLPRRVDGNPESLNVKASRKQFHIPVGGSYLFPESGITLGLSLIYTYDNRSLKGAQVTNPSTTLVNMKASGHFLRPVFGATWASDNTSAGLSYMLPLTKHFKGKTSLATETDSFDTEQVDYDPAVLLTSARVNVQDATISANVNRVFAAKGRGIQRDGLNRKTKTADLKDANHIGIRGGYKTADFGEFSLAAAYLDSFWGDGFYYTDQEGIPHHEIGHVFGQFNGIPVHNQAASWRKNFGSWHATAAIYRTAGATTVAPRGDNPGFYQIEFLSLTCSVRRVL